MFITLFDPSVEFLRRRRFCHCPSLLFVSQPFPQRCEIVSWEGVRSPRKSLRTAKFFLKSRLQFPQSSPFSLQPLFSVALGSLLLRCGFSVNVWKPVPGWSGEAGGHPRRLVQLSPSAVQSVSVSTPCPKGRFSGALGTGQNISPWWVSLLGQYVVETGRMRRLCTLGWSTSVQFLLGRATFSFVSFLVSVCSLHPRPNLRWVSQVGSCFPSGGQHFGLFWVETWLLQVPLCRPGCGRHKGKRREAVDSALWHIGLINCSRLLLVLFPVGLCVGASQAAWEKLLGSPRVCTTGSWFPPFCFVPIWFHPFSIFQKFDRISLSLFFFFHSQYCHGLIPPLFSAPCYFTRI